MKLTEVFSIGSVETSSSVVLVCLIVFLINHNTCDAGIFYDADGHWIGDRPTNRAVFPSLMQVINSEATTIHVIGRLIKNSTQTTFEHYADFKSGRSLARHLNEQSVKLYRPETNKTYEYWPYSCRSEDTWTQNREYSSAYVILAPGKLLYLEGPLALWYLAEYYYTNKESITRFPFEHTEPSQPTSKWKFSNGYMDMYFEFILHPNSSNASAPSMFQLTWIYLTVLGDSFPYETYDVPHMDVVESNDRRLSLPVGYGCITDPRDFEPLSVASVQEFHLDKHFLELEITATKFSDGIISHTDTTYLDQIYWHGQDHGGYFRHHDSLRDEKIIFDGQYNIQYNINSRKRECEAINLSGNVKQMMEMKFELNFNNGLKFKFDKSIMELLFVKDVDLYSIKKENSSSGEDIFYYESRSDNLVIAQRSRFIRIYKMDAKSRQLRLTSVKVWIFDATHTHVTESFEINIIRRTYGPSMANWRSLFDISTECYIENEAKLAGRDYIFFRLVYPIGNLKLNSETMSLFEFKLRNVLGNLRTPKIEFEFHESSIAIRFLLLELPSLELMFNRTTGVELIDSPMFVMEDLAVDLAHCSELCRIHLCSAWSYCGSKFRCRLLGSQTTQRVGDSNFSENQNGCDLFELPKSMTENPYKTNLLRVVSELQHTEFDLVQLPGVPDEISRPIKDTGINEAQFNSAVNSYRKLVMDSLSQEGEILKKFVFDFILNGTYRIFVPSLFELEMDARAKFNAKSPADQLWDSTNESTAPSGEVYPKFHGSLPMTRFKMTSLKQDHEFRFKKLDGISYDQCSSFCADNSCYSFSYCTHSRACVVTQKTIDQLNREDLVEQAPDCLIAGRDFLTKFHQLPHLYLPPKNISGDFPPPKEVTSASECARYCSTEFGDDCLGFRLCLFSQAGGGTIMGRHRMMQTGTHCYVERKQTHLEEEGTRNLLVDSLEQNLREEWSPKSKPENWSGWAKCSRYRRNHLIDFVRIDHKHLEEAQLLKVTVGTLINSSAGKCASACLRRNSQCSAFQLCLNTKDKLDDFSRCHLIENIPGDEHNANPGIKLLNGSNFSEDMIVAGKVLDWSANCHIFKLKKDRASYVVETSNQASLVETTERQVPTGASGVSVLGCLALFSFVCTSIASLTIYTIFRYAKDEFVSQKMEQIRLLLVENHPKGPNEFRSTRNEPNT